MLFNAARRLGPEPGVATLDHGPRTGSIPVTRTQQATPAVACSVCCIPDSIKRLDEDTTRMEEFTVFISGTLATYSAIGWTSDDPELAVLLNHRTHEERARRQFTNDALGRLHAALYLALAQKARLLPTRVSVQRKRA